MCQIWLDCLILWFYELSIPLSSTFFETWKGGNFDSPLPPCLWSPWRGDSPIEIFEISSGHHTPYFTLFVTSLNCCDEKLNYRVTSTCLTLFKWIYRFTTDIEVQNYLFKFNYKWQNRLTTNDIFNNFKFSTYNW